MATVGDIINIIEQFAGSHLSESWDNCGLQIGDKKRPVRKIVTALDPLDEVVDYACSVKADLLVTHHPLIFKPLKSIDLSSPQGNLIKKAFENDLAVYSAHTNFDSAKGGLNDVFARTLGLTGTTILGRPVYPERLKLVIFTPHDHKDRILGALSDTTAGIIGNYTCCSFSCQGQGRFKPGEGADPFSGHVGEFSTEDEVRIETVIHKRDAGHVIKHVARVHPYETMAYDLYPLASDTADEGLGRIGKLEKSMPFKAFVGRIKERFGVETVKVAGNTDIMVDSVALCTGSGSGMVREFLRSSADVYVSGDLHYHDARDVEVANRAMVDVGHFASEIIVARALKEALSHVLSQKGYAIEVDACTVEEDPFMYL